MAREWRDYACLSHPSFVCRESIRVAASFILRHGSDVFTRAFHTKAQYTTNGIRIVQHSSNRLGRSYRNLVFYVLCPLFAFFACCGFLRISRAMCGSSQFSQVFLGSCYELGFCSSTCFRTFQFSYFLLPPPPRLTQPLLSIFSSVPGGPTVTCMLYAFRCLCKDSTSFPVWP